MTSLAFELYVIVPLFVGNTCVFFPLLEDEVVSLELPQAVIRAANRQSMTNVPGKTAGARLLLTLMKERERNIP